MSEGTEGDVQVKVEAELTPADGGGIIARITCDKDPRQLEMALLAAEVKKVLLEKYTQTGHPIRFAQQRLSSLRVLAAYGTWNERPASKLFLLTTMLMKVGDWNLNLRTGMYWVEGLL